jgi:hypothetical protein
MNFTCVFIWVMGFISGTVVGFMLGSKNDPTN